jgi:hypothetical protein
LHLHVNGPGLNALKRYRLDPHDHGQLPEQA